MEFIILHFKFTIMFQYISYVVVYQQMTVEDLSCKVGPECSLVLSDGTVFTGKSFGARLPAEGEVG